MRLMMTDRALHPLAERIAGAFRAGRLCRREYLASMAGLGVTMAGARMLGGLAAPAPARAEEPVRGGQLRIGQQVHPFKDPRAFDWPHIANVARQCNEYAVRWTADFEFEPRLLESWEVSDDARVYTLKVRSGITWSNGDALSAEDIAHNVRRWSDASAEGNSMAARMGSLVDPDTKTLRSDALEIVDDLTLRLDFAEPDVTLIASLADYPALVMHRSYEGTNDPFEALSVTTGPCELVEYEPSVVARVRRKEDHDWWGGDFWLDEVEWIDLGEDPVAALAAIEAGEIHANYETIGDAVPQWEAAGAEVPGIDSAQTVVLRMNTKNEPYGDRRVRRALQLGVDNRVVLNLGVEGRGAVAHNHHVGEMHVDYADVGPATRDVEQSRRLIEEAGHADTEFELISIDDDWMRNTSDAVAAMLRDAGYTVKRTVIPGSTFWNDWTKYPFSATSWNPRPLGIQILNLAYRSGAAWNESAHEDPEFDALLDRALATPDPDQRREVMAELQTMLRESGVIIQPFWRKIYRSHLPEVKGYGTHQAVEQHLDLVWLES